MLPRRGLQSRRTHRLAKAAPAQLARGGPASVATSDFGVSSFNSNMETPIYNRSFQGWSVSVIYQLDLVITLEVGDHETYRAVIRRNGDCRARGGRDIRQTPRPGEDCLVDHITELSRNHISLDGYDPVWPRASNPCSRTISESAKEPSTSH